MGLLNGRVGKLGGGAPDMKNNEPSTVRHKIAMCLVILFVLLMRARGQGADLSLFLLGLQVFRVGFDQIGPVTMALLGINTLLFYYELDLPFSLEVYDVCIGAAQVWVGKEWGRLLLHAFVHASPTHLYYNMSSLLLKGRLLEPVLGPVAFAWLVFSFTLASGALLTAISFIGDSLFPEYRLLSTCAVGFSGVLFALNTVLPHVLVQPEQSNVWGIDVPTKYLTLAELVLISFLVPNASFLGHLCGILVGYAYVSRKFDFFFMLPQLVFAGDAYVRGGAYNNQNNNRQGRNNAGGYFVDNNGVLRRPQ